VDSVEPTLIDRLATQAGVFVADLSGREGARRVPMPDFRAMAERLGTLSKPVVWLNDVFKGPEFRWAHVEFFSIPDYIAVLHV